MVDTLCVGWLQHRMWFSWKCQHTTQNYYFYLPFPTEKKVASVFWAAQINLQESLLLLLLVRHVVSFHTICDVTWSAMRKKKKNVKSLLFLSRFSVALTVLKTPPNWSCANTSFTLYFKTQKRLGLIWIFWESSQCPQTSSCGVRQPIASLSWQF